MTSPSFCTSSREKVYITAIGCEIEFGSARELPGAIPLKDTVNDANFIFLIWGSTVGVLVGAVGISLAGGSVVWASSQHDFRDGSRPCLSRGNSAPGGE